MLGKAEIERSSLFMAMTDEEEKKIVSALPSGVNVIKLFTAIIYKFS